MTPLLAKCARHTNPGKMSLSDTRTDRNLCDLLLGDLEAD